MRPAEPAGQGQDTRLWRPRWPTRQGEGDPHDHRDDARHSAQPRRRLRLSAGSWRVDPTRSHAWFAARVADRLVRGRLPLTGGVLIAEPVEDSTARLAARASAISTGSPVLDRLLTGPGFLDAGAFPEIIFRSELLVWVPGRMAGCRLPAGQEH